MIDKEQIDIDWINKVAKANRNTDQILVEKAIRALLLLEGLAQSEVSFVFKGGTSLMLHFKSSKRLSIDIDIIISNNNLEKLDDTFLSIINLKGFTRVELQRRAKQSDIEKAHYKFSYKPICQTTKEEDYILLDILFEEIAYKNIIKLPVVSSFVPMKGEPIAVKVPSLEDMLGDKLTAFAPNTTGIPYYKGEDSMSMEIIKQLYDIGNLFDVCLDLEIVKTTFSRFAKTELAYRANGNATEKDVLDDIFQTSLCITSRGAFGSGNFKELQLGVKRIAGFIFSESYHIEKVIVSASKAAYLSSLIQSNKDTFEKFENPLQTKDWTIDNPKYNKFNKFKKNNPEAFFYWYKIVEIKTQNMNYRC